MADLTIEEIVEGGLNAAYAAAAGGGDAALNSAGDLVLHVKNDDAAPMTVTVAAQTATRKLPGYGDLTKADAVVAIPAGEDRFIGPFPPRAFNDVDGKVQITYSAVTSVTIAALRVPKA